MAERKDLIAIADMLDMHGDKHQDRDNETDIGILHKIVTSLESLLEHDQNRHESIPNNRNKLITAFSTNGRFPDSLAFPKPVRDSQNLSENHQLWKDLRKFNDLLRNDYSCRRQMLISRLDCTVESFKWKSSEVRKQAHLEAAEDKKSHKDKKSLNDLIHEKYDQARVGLVNEPQITISHLLALRETDCDSLLNSVVSTKSVDCQVLYKPTKQQRQNNTGQLVNLKQVIIPEVPDRGGRTDEMRMPSKETFSQQRRGRAGGKRY